MEIVKILRDTGADINASASDGGRTALQAAAEGGYVEIVKLLMNAGADIHAIGQLGKTALYTAAEAGSVTTVEVLMNACDESNLTECNSSLLSASEEGHFAVVNLLLSSRKVNINTCNLYGLTSLHLAVSHRRNSVTSLLLAWKAKIDVRNTENKTPLHIALERKYLDTLQILLKNGASTAGVAADEIRNILTVTPEQFVALYGEPTGAKDVEIVHYKASPNQTSHPEQPIQLFLCVFATFLPHVNVS